MHVFAVIVALVGAGHVHHHQYSPLLASSRIGAITADCSDYAHAKITFRADYLTPGETVVARAGKRRVRGEVYSGRPLRITVPLVRQRYRAGAFADITPVVSWRVFQSHEPDETRARAKLRLTTGQDGCEPVLAWLRLKSRSHAG